MCIHTHTTCMRTSLLIHLIHPQLFLENPVCQELCEGLSYMARNNQMPFPILLDLTSHNSMDQDFVAL